MKRTPTLAALSALTDSSALAQTADTIAPSMISCRHYIMRTLLPILALCGLRLNGAFAADTADTIYHGGPVITINDAALRAEAVAVKDGKIMAVGTKEEPIIWTSDDPPGSQVQGAWGGIVINGRARVNPPSLPTARG